MADRRAGALSNKDKEFLRANAGKMSAEAMASLLGRRDATVKKWLFDNPPASPVDEKIAEAREDLRGSLSWKKLKEEFTETELAYFEEEYAAWVAQFKEDVLATEVTQIRKTITMDILMRRNLVARRKCLEEIEHFEKWRKSARADFRKNKATMSEEQRAAAEARLLNIEGMLQAARAAEQSKTREYTDLGGEHQRMMKDLKATRDQRISRIESSRETYLGILRQLQEEERREELGRQMRLEERATEKEAARLGRPHRYDDGQSDLPILSAETVAAADAADDGEKQECAETSGPNTPLDYLSVIPEGTPTKN